MKRTEEMVLTERGSEAIAERMREILVELGEDPTREGLRGTPGRVARALL